MDPSAVISATWNTRNVMKTPKASRDRINPIVKDPTSKVILDPSNRRKPACASHKFAFTRAVDCARIVEQVHYALDTSGVKKRGHGCLQIERSLLQRAVRKYGGMKMPNGPLPNGDRSQHRKDIVAILL